MTRRITGLSSMATRHILADLARDYELGHGVKVEIRSMGGVEAAKLARAGERDGRRRAGVEGHGRAWRPKVISPEGSIRDFARSEIGIAVPAGAPRPSVDSEKAVRQAMIEAKRVGYSTGPSGDHFKALCERWGLSDSVLARALKAPPGVPVATLVANGEADLGVQQLSELIGQPGIEVVGPLPGGDSGRDRLFGRRVDDVRRARGRAGSRGLSGLGCNGGRQATARHGAGMNARPERESES